MLKRLACHSVIVCGIPWYTSSLHAKRVLDLLGHFMVATHLRNRVRADDTSRYRLLTRSSYWSCARFLTRSLYMMGDWNVEASLQ